MPVLPATPQLTSTRRGGSTSRYCPRTGMPLMSTSKAPPGTGLRTACWPIQRIMAAGSVRCRKTSSAGAGRSTSVVNWSAMVLLRLRAGVGERGTELAQVLGPEAGQELLHCREPVRVDHEQVPGSLAALVDQPSVVQHFQVPGHRLRRDVEMVGDISDRARFAGD